MITVFNATKNTTPLTDAQHAELIRCIDLYANTPNGAWLKEVDCRLFNYLWKFDLEGTEVQAIRPLTGDCIILQPNGDNPDYWVQLMAAPAIHELRHVWQRKKYGLLAYSLLAPFGRLFPEDAPLEKDAFDQQDKATMFIQKMEGIK
jgi:hypothetical protein